MPAILPSLSLDSHRVLTRFFMPHQVNWIEAEEHIHNQGRQAIALAEKSVRIGWTYADAFKNVRKRLRFPNRDYLFASKDYPSALEYMRLAYKFADFFNHTRAIVSRGEEHIKVQRLDSSGRPTAFTDNLKIGVIKFDNGSRILAFSSHPQAMAVYGGDVGIDEFAKHPNAKLLWETAQGRVTWGGDLAIWSAHDGEDTLFYQFARQARAACGSPLPLTDSLTHSPSNSHSSPTSHLPSPNSSAWNLYYRVTMPDALELGLLDVINRVRGTHLSKQQFLADCRARAGLDEIYEQSYLCNPVPGGAGITDWSAIERCRYDYEISRLHLEHDQVQAQFGQFNPDLTRRREERIKTLIRTHFSELFDASDSQRSGVKARPPKFRLGFDVAASGKGDLAAIYIDEFKGPNHWLRALFTCRTDDWHFLKTVLFCFLDDLRSIRAAGDSSGLGRQLCWEAAGRFSWAFTPVNFATQKHDLGFALMNQLANAEKRFPRNQQDIAADFFALRKSFHNGRWVFSETKNLHNPASHCDLAWAAALASEAHTTNEVSVGAAVG